MDEKAQAISRPPRPPRSRASTVAEPGPPGSDPVSDPPGHLFWDTSLECCSTRLYEVDLPTKSGTVSMVLFVSVVRDAGDTRVVFRAPAVAALNEGWGAQPRSPSA